VATSAIGLRRDGEANVDGHAHQELKELAELTGGAPYFPDRPEQLGEAAVEIATEIVSQYTNAEVPPDRSPNGSYSKLRVVVRKSDERHVRARTGYRATRDSSRRAGSRKQQEGSGEV